MPTGKLCGKTTAKPGTKPILLRSISFIARRCRKKKRPNCVKKQTAHAAPACRNPEKAAADARKYWRQMPQEKKDYQRIVSRGRNRKYREENRETIRSRNNERRRRLKEENPELLKEIDRRHNQNANRQQSCREYYLKIRKNSRQGQGKSESQRIQTPLQTQTAFQEQYRQNHFGPAAGNCRF